MIRPANPTIQSSFLEDLDGGGSAIRLSLPRARGDQTRTGEWTQEVYGRTLFGGVAVCHQPSPRDRAAFDMTDVEDRFLTIGVSADGRALLVSHADRGDSIRIISARKADKQEREEYVDGNC